jgi:adenylate cyclase
MPENVLLVARDRRKAVPQRRARAQLGDVLIYKGQPDAAIAEFERAIALNPHFIDYRYAKALSYAGESARAIEIPEANMRLDPLAAAYAQSGQLEEARAEAEKVLRINPGFTIERYKRLSVYKNAEDDEHRIDGLRKAGLPET